MRRLLIVIFILIFALVCFGTTFPLKIFTSTITSTLIQPTTTVIPATSTPTATITVSPLPPTSTPTPTANPTVTPQSESFNVLYHPDDVLYVGDQVSMEVISPPDSDFKDATVQAQIDPPSGLTLSPVKFAAWGIQGRQEATFLWGWDTTNETPGGHTLTYTVMPQGYTWSEQVNLLPASEMPAYQASAKWESTQTQCCTVYYVSNTASERDLSTLVAQIDEQAKSAIDEMDSSFTQPITITILPRLLGHGGFTSDEISVSYLDRNYASNAWELVVHHEMIHAIDGHLGGDFRPSIFVEGLAVYETGGHYKLEPLMPRAAALLPEHLNRYIPLKTLADDFYASQHEIGYMEGASLIDYMVKTYGWDAFSSFYRDMHIKNGESQSQAIDTALQAHFSITFDTLEQNYKAALESQADVEAWVDDVRLTVDYYETMRRYQQLLDPSAYFRTAWLLDNKTMRQKGIVADYLRHPNQPENLALEAMLISAARLMSTQKFADASHLLGEVNLVLDGIEHETTDPFSASPLAVDYLGVASTLKNQGYETQSIDVSSNSAIANATTASGPDVIELHLTRSGGEWVLAAP